MLTCACLLGKYLCLQIKQRKKKKEKKTLSEMIPRILLLYRDVYLRNVDFLVFVWHQQHEQITEKKKKKIRGGQAACSNQRMCWIKLDLTVNAVLPFKLYVLFFFSDYILLQSKFNDFNYVITTWQHQLYFLRLKVIFQKKSQSILPENNIKNKAWLCTETSVISRDGSM